MTISGISRALACALVGLLAACSSSSVSDRWIDPVPGEPLRKVAVLGLADAAAARLSFEQEFAAQWNDRGLTTLASTELVPAETEPDRDALAAAFAAAGIDGVISVRVLRVDQRVRSDPAPRGRVGYYDHYHRGYGGSYAWGDIRTYEVVRLEANLHRLPEDRLVWSGACQLTDPRSAEAAAQKLAGDIWAELSAAGLIAPAASSRP